MIVTIIDTKFLSISKKLSEITNPKSSNYQIGKSLKLWSEKAMQG